MKKGFEFRLRSLIQLALILSILLSTALITGMVYRSLQQVILGGFDRKLKAVSTVTATFIDARDHERILAPRNIRALAVRPDSSQIIGVDTSFGEINFVEIDRETGGARDLRQASESPVSLAIFPGKRSMHGAVVDSDGSVRLLEIDFETGMKELFRLPEGSRAIAFDGLSQVVYAGGQNGIFRVELDTGDAVLLDGAGSDLDVHEITYSPDSKCLIAFDPGQRILAKIDPESGNILESRTADSYSLTSLSSDPETGGILGTTSDSLVRINPKTLECTHDDLVPGFRNERAALFLQYVAPMRMIKSRCDLTFLYTQTLSDSGEVRYIGSRRERVDNTAVKKIIYVLDAETGSYHSPIGQSRGEIASESIRDVFFKGGIHLTGIERWQHWGLIKSGYAPILREEDGEIIAMAGADVSVEKIEQKNKSALARVVVTCLGALVLALVVSVFASRTLTGPIERLKDASLKIASGDYGVEIEETRLKELNEVSRTFNQMGDTLRDSVEVLEATNREWETDRRSFELIRFLTVRNAEVAGLRTWIEVIASQPPYLCGSGWTNSRQRVVGWIADDAGRSRDENLAFRACVTSVFHQIIRRSEDGSEWEELQKWVKTCLPDALKVLFLIDLDQLTVKVETYSGEPVLWQQDDKAQSAPKITGLKSGEFEIHAGMKYVICSEREFVSLLRTTESTSGETVITNVKGTLSEHESPAIGIAIELRNNLEENGKEGEHDSD
ncbi:MAG: HAMP domain-containing protein [Verrucomicrobiales bacterium]|nr:HAMP domain-containing protein [Verrucomicrobiales bacterium]